MKKNVTSPLASSSEAEMPTVAFLSAEENLTDFTRTSMSV